MSDKLTIWQRILRKPINFLVEKWFPRGAFFGDDYLTAFERLDKERGMHMGSAALYLINRIRDAGGEGGNIEMLGLTTNGEHIGDWVLRVEKIGEQNKPKTRLSDSPV